MTCLAEDLNEDSKFSKRVLKEIRTTQKRLDILENKVEKLKGEIEDTEITISTQPKESYPASGEQQKHSEDRDQKNSVDWASVLEEAEKRLRERGINPQDVSLNNLLDKKEVQLIEKRFSGGFTIKTHLDPYDVIAAIVAGLVAGAVDLFVVKIPKDITYLGRFVQKGSPLTKWLHSLSISDKNWLAKYFKVAYDKVKDVGIPGFGPRTHRLQTFGHDPLVGLVIGTIDIMRGGMTAISKSGKIIKLAGTGTAHYNPFTAIVWQIMHLFSDGFTKMGLPPPGWSVLQAFQIGSFGKKERTVAELARWMYLNGYDSRHFLTMSTSVAAAEVILRGYFWIRRKIDEQYDTEVTHEGEVAGAKRTGGHPRFQTMALIAHGIASAINIGKIAIYSGNPLAINYTQWVRFIYAFIAWVRTKLRSPSKVLMEHARTNWKELQKGWGSILDVGEDSFPTFVVRS